MEQKYFIFRILIENAQPVRPWSIWLICILNYKWILRALSSNQVMRVDKKVNLIRQMNNSKVNFRVIITTFFNKFIYFQTRKSYTSSEIIAMIMRQLFSDICCTQKLVHILEWSWLNQKLNASHILWFFILLILFFDRPSAFSIAIFAKFFPIFIFGSVLG